MKALILLYNICVYIKFASLKRAIFVCLLVVFYRYKICVGNCVGDLLSVLCVLSNNQKHITF